MTKDEISVIVEDVMNKNHVVNEDYVISIQTSIMESIMEDVSSLIDCKIKNAIEKLKIN